MVLNSTGIVNISHILLIPKGILTKTLGNLAPYLGGTITAKGGKIGEPFCDVKK